MLVRASEDLVDVYSHEGRRFLLINGDLADARQILDREAARRAEVTHDARSVIAALRAATTTLQRYDADLGPEVKAQLRGAVVEELARLEDLIDPQVRTSTELDLADTLAPLVRAQRETGQRIDIHLDGARARARAYDLTTAVQNLLVNAGRHAPGSEVTVTARTDEYDVRLFVEDRGPGVPLSEREEIFRRGVRSNASKGSGLGLYIARKLLQEMDGQLEVQPRPGGGARFVLTLPAATTPPIPEHRECGARVG